MKHAHLHQALAFIKPHAVASAETLDYVLGSFLRYGIEVLHRRRIPAEEIAAGGLVDRHYAANAHFGLFESASAILLQDEAKQTFEIAFEERWDEAVQAGKVFSGEAMRRKLGHISSEALNTLWSEYGARKLSGGCYVSWFEREECYVVNGFYPDVREQFIRPGASVELMVVAFDFPWITFRRDIIGSTNPAAADERSIRGHLHDHGASFGLKVDSHDNVIHASASPFEAFCELEIWLPDRSRSSDPLWRQIHRKSGLSPKDLAETLLRWHSANPVVTVDDRTGPILDVFEDRDSPEVAAALLQLLASA